MSATPPTQRHLRVLCLEDSPSDAEQIRRVLVAAGYDLELDLAAERGRFEELLAGHPYDVILADYRLAGFDARAALELATAACPRTPFVCVSAAIADEIAAELLKGGAVEVVLKERLGRLPIAVERAIAAKARQGEPPPAPDARGERFRGRLLDRAPAADASGQPGGPSPGGGRRA
ncbi:MAG: response regulator [Thermoleophilia bacterium]